MGYNTVAVLYNDYCGVGKMPIEVEDAVKYVDVNGCENYRRFGYGATICQAHSSHLQVVVVGRNTGWSLDNLPHDYTEDVVWSLKQFLESRGYRVVKRRQPKPPQHARA